MYPVPSKISLAGRFSSNLSAAAYKNEGDLREAEMQYRESLGIQDDALTRLCLGDLLFVKGDARGALKQYTSAIELKPTNAQAHGKLAEALVHSLDTRLLDVTQAVKEARKACELSHYHKRELLILLTECYGKNHQIELANDVANKALLISVGPQQIEEARRLVASIRQIPVTVRKSTVGRNGQTNEQ